MLAECGSGGSTCVESGLTDLFGRLVLSESTSLLPELQPFNTSPIRRAIRLLAPLVTELVSCFTSSARKWTGCPIVLPRTTYSGACGYRKLRPI